MQRGWQHWMVPGGTAWWCSAPMPLPAHSLPKVRLARMKFTFWGAGVLFCSQTQGGTEAVFFSPFLDENQCPLMV